MSMPTEQELVIASILAPPPEYQATDLLSSIHGAYFTGDATAKPMGMKSLRFQYWRKCTKDLCRIHSNKYTGRNIEKGWIAVGPTMAGDPLQHATFINEKHMTPLPQYGDSSVGENGRLTSKQGRFDQLIERGGIQEFPADQIIAYGWDKLEPIRALRPDVVAVSKRWACQYSCDNRDFPSESSLIQHNRAVHKDVVGPEATGREMKTALLEFAQMTTGVGSATPPVAMPSTTTAPAPTGGVDYEKIAAIAAQAAAAAVMAFESQRMAMAAPAKRGPGRPRKTAVIEEAEPEATDFSDV